MTSDLLLDKHPTFRPNQSIVNVFQVVGFGEHEDDPPPPESAPQTETPPSTPPSTPPPPPSVYGEVDQLTFLEATTPFLQEATPITDIRAFTSSLPLHPHHKVLS